MNQSSAGYDRFAVEDIAIVLVKEAEQCLANGLADHALRLAQEAWEIAGKQAAQLADLVAWRAGWMLMGAGYYADASDWFNRVDSPPREAGRPAPADIRSLVRLCQLASNGKGAEQMPPTQVSARLLFSSGRSLSLPPLHIEDMGRLRIVRDGEALPQHRGRKSLGMLVYLLSRPGRSVPAEELMELLWPEVSPREARHSLHAAVSALRAYLDPSEKSYLQFEQGRYLLDPEAEVTNDSERFQAYCKDGDQSWRQGAWTAAEDSYRGALARYYGDFHVDDLGLDWAVSHRERLLARYMSALDHLGQILVREQKLEEAIDLFQLVLDRDPYREDVHGQLIRCYLGMGQRGNAIRQYTRCQTVLERDLGIQPMAATRLLLTG